MIFDFLDRKSSVSKSLWAKTVLDTIFPTQGCRKITTNDIIVNIIIAGYLDCIYTRGFPFIFFLIKKRSKKIKLKIGNCYAPFTIGFTCVVPAHRTSNPSFIIADFQRTTPTLIYKHSTTIEIYTLRSKKCHSQLNEIFFRGLELTILFGFGLKYKLGWRD